MTPMMDQVQLRLELVKLTHSNGIEARHVLERAATYEAWITSSEGKRAPKRGQPQTEGTPEGSS